MQAIRTALEAQEDSCGTFAEYRNFLKKHHVGVEKINEEYMRVFVTGEALTHLGVGAVRYMSGTTAAKKGHTWGAVYDSVDALAVKMFEKREKCEADEIWVQMMYAMHAGLPDGKPGRTLLESKLQKAQQHFEFEYE
jgi:hypothetical protein